ncbi:MAG: hypothetical protein NTZ61_17290 [Proteobacteria bacterium]|nr:hypothetical protein [Pseudomonadota bacterium]
MIRRLVAVVISTHALAAAAGESETTNGFVLSLSGLLLYDHGAQSHPKTPTAGLRLADVEIVAGYGFEWMAFHLESSVFVAGSKRGSSAPASESDEAGGVH